MKEDLMKISRILATKGSSIVTIPPDLTVREAIALLLDHNIGSLPVVEGAGKLIGIITERDIIRALAKDETIFADPVEQFMTRDVITGLPQDDLESVANTMTEQRFRHLPIMEGNKLVGIVSIGDVVKAQRDEYRGKVDTLQAQIIEEES
jgi:CBS domain-containing protein